MDKAFDEINAALLEAIEHASGKEMKIVLHKPKSVEIKAIRTKAGLSQESFLIFSDFRKRPKPIQTSFFSFGSPGLYSPIAIHSSLPFSATARVSPA